MIDWITAKLPCRHTPLKTGVVFSVDEDDQIEWECMKRKVVEGSYSSKVTVKSFGAKNGKAEYLLFSGNPSKGLQGHNVFGSDDAISLMYDMFKIIVDKLGIEPELSDLKKIRAGDYTISRIDINYMFVMKSRNESLAWLRAAEKKSRLRSGRAVFKGNTLYWGKESGKDGVESQRWIFKAYIKIIELESRKKMHRLPFELEQTELKAWAENKLRFELVLKQKELQERKLDKLNVINERVNGLFNEYMGRINMSGQMVLTDDIFDGLPRHLQRTYLLWKDGVDVREKSKISKASFYKHRTALLNYGIDISMECDTAVDTSNVVPLVRVIEAKPCAIPDWAFIEKLVHHSATNNHLKVA
jgi:II/X family phage/plasmid replication protein